MQKFQGGRSRYILKVPVHFRTYTIQRHRNFNLVVRVAELIVWRPYSHNADNTKIPTLKGGRSHYKRSVLKVHKARNTKIHKFKGGRSRYKLVGCYFKAFQIGIYMPPAPGTEEMHGSESNAL